MIERNAGWVVANTKDFQQSCIVILNREAMLKDVVREIERHQQQYKNQEECSRIINHAATMENPRDLVTVLAKTQSGINFFSANPDY